jgi:signal transduction histidine kinase
VSLTLSGVLTGVLVRQLEIQNAREQLVRSALMARPQILASDCTQRNTTTKRCLYPTTEAEFADTVAGRLGGQYLGGNRLILLSRPPLKPRVVYDSDGMIPPGTPLGLSREQTVAGEPVASGTVQLDGGGPYIYSAIRVGPASRFAGELVMARPRDAVTGQATTQLLPIISLSGAAALALAILVTLVLGRAFSRPLKEMKSASEDIAAGNYSRRVRATGDDEIGVVGQSFNRMADKVETARRLQRDFLANVSHELKTPLTSLIGFSQALMDGSLETEAERVRAATILNEESQRVLRMSQELLELARVESGQLTVNAEPVDLAAQIQQELDIVTKRADARWLDLRRDLAPGLPPVMADPERLHQILENLLDNAVKYAPAASRVQVSAELAGGGRLRTSVRNLVGQPAPDPERMFDRFYRADPARSSAAGGVGLGLAISRELAAAQGGSLTATVEADGWLCMSLELPAAERTQPPAPRRFIPLRDPGRLESVDRGARADRPPGVDR